jgi:hypothetical protein
MMEVVDLVLHYQKLATSILMVTMILQLELLLKEMVLFIFIWVALPDCHRHQVKKLLLPSPSQPSMGAVLCLDMLYLEALILTAIFITV